MALNRRQLMSSLLGGLCARSLKGMKPAPGFTERGPEKHPLSDGFSHPPHSAKPWVYWMWMNGNITHEGITADLEAMKSAGIGGALIMNLGYDEPGPVRFMTDEWRKMFGHAVNEAGRLGLVIDMNNDDGWNCGGPAITPANAMQKVVWTETHVQGPREISASLAQPLTTWRLYRDICVLAFPRPAGDEIDSALLNPKIITSPGNPPFIQLEFAEPFVARAAVLSAASRQGRPGNCELQVSADGRAFRRVRQFETGWQYPVSTYSSMTIGFKEARGRFYRLLAPGVDVAQANSLRLRVQLLGGSRISFWEFKGGFTNIREYGAGIPFFLTTGQDASAALDKNTSIRREDVIDLTGMMDAAGRLRWAVPAGNWTVLRIGYTPTGQLNSTASSSEGKGPDCNKLSPSGTGAQFHAVLGKLLTDVAPSGARTFTYAHNDSWESGCQNWTAEFREEFHRRCGYDLLPHLPVLAGGRVVENIENSERFLWDVRRTIADLIAEFYWEALWKDCNARGLKFSEEAGGRQQFMYDPVNYLSKGDIPMGEFWMGEAQPRPDCKLAASAAHIYGKRLIGGEAFTCISSKTRPSAGKWKSHPFSLKPLGDRAFCTGINHFTFHRCVLQPWLDRRPGLAWAAGDNVTIGTSFERTQTWWKPGAAWIEYLSRCQFLLQQGNFVADVCVFTGESVPNVLFRPYQQINLAPETEDASLSTERALIHSGLSPALPPSGYDFDGCNVETLAQMSVRNGRLVLPCGMSYRLLTLPLLPDVTPHTLRLVKKLVEAGATAVGPKPASSPSLSGHPACDDEVRQLAGQVWGACDGKTVKENSFGNGKVIWGKPMSEILASVGVEPDFEYSNLQSDTDLDYVHRSAGDAEIYFVSNQQNRFEEAECTFRISGREPELWCPDTGRIFRCGVYEAREGRITIPLRLDPYGSVFAVFRKPSRATSITLISRNGREFPKFANGLGDRFQGMEIEATEDGGFIIATAVPGEYEFKTSGGRIITARVPPQPATREIGGHWDVHFPPNWGAPENVTLENLISWTEHGDDGVKYFSGTATYWKEFEIPAKMTAPDQALYLDLGEVKELATVKLNGRELGVLWKPPFRVEISGVANPGANRLELEITNLWPNRLIGNLRLPKDKRFGWTNRNPYTENSPLLASGLIGPVRIRAAARMQLRL
jgi:hypothetical protein